MKWSRRLERVFKTGGHLSFIFHAYKHVNLPFVFHVVLMWQFLGLLLVPTIHTKYMEQKEEKKMVLFIISTIPQSNFLWYGINFIKNYYYYKPRQSPVFNSIWCLVTADVKFNWGFVISVDIINKKENTHYLQQHQIFISLIFSSRWCLISYIVYLTAQKKRKYFTHNP